MNTKLWPLFLAACFFLAPGLSAESVRISQIDTQSLLLNQQIKLYLSVTDKNGRPLENLGKNNFDLFESSDNKKYESVRGNIGFKTGANYENGVNFLLMLDNSGSMYRTLEGKSTKRVQDRRITFAKQAVENFLESITNPKDRIGLVSYNSYYSSYSPLISNKDKIKTYLNEISRPKGDEAYTEIYGSLLLAVDEFKYVRGRKAIIILSDGENSPFYTNTKKEHKRFGKQIIKYQEPIKEFQLEGISLYVVYFGKKGDAKDKHLHKIAAQTGGTSFDAHNQQELQQVYLTIMDQILKEYVVTYRAGMLPGDKRYIKVGYQNRKRKAESARFYFSGTVFGRPLNQFHPLIAIALISALILWYLLTKLKFEKQRSTPAVEVLGVESGNISTKTIALDNPQTIIGCSAEADLTIAGVPSVEERHATIIFDDKKQQYQLSGEGRVLVNNQEVTTKVLESGDLININGVTMVFDEGAKSEATVVK